MRLPSVLLLVLTACGNDRAERGPVGCGEKFRALYGKPRRRARACGLQSVRGVQLVANGVARERVRFIAYKKNNKVNEGGRCS